MKHVKCQKSKQKTEPEIEAVISYWTVRTMSVTRGQCVRNVWRTVLGEKNDVDYCRVLMICQTARIGASVLARNGGLSAREICSVARDTSPLLHTDPHAMLRDHSLRAPLSLADKQTRRFSHARRRLSPSSRHLPYCAFADSHLTADARSQTNRLLSPARVSRYPCPIHCSLPPFPSLHPAWSIAHALFIAPLSVVVLIIEFLFLFFSGVFSAWNSVIDSGTVWWKSAITPLGWIIYIYEKKCFFM